MYVYRPRPFISGGSYGSHQPWIGTAVAAADVTIIGVRALSTATAQPGFITEGVVGERATATATGQPGFVTIAVIGVRGAATATAQVGIPKIAVTGIRGIATATAQPGTVDTGGPAIVITSRRTLVGVGV